MYFEVSTSLMHIRFYFSIYRLKKLLADVPPEKLNKPCIEYHLSEIALSITDWRSVAPYLGLTEVEENDIETDHRTAIPKKIAMLRKWRSKFGQRATYKELAKAFWKLRLMGLVQKVCEVLSDTSSHSNSDSDTDTSSDALDTITVTEEITGIRQRRKKLEEKDSIDVYNASEHPDNRSQNSRGCTAYWKLFLTTAVILIFMSFGLLLYPTSKPLCIRESDIKNAFRTQGKMLLQDADSASANISVCESTSDVLSSYAEFLRSRYSTVIPFFHTKLWPPSPTREVLDLAMIKQKNIRYGPVDEELTRLLLRGKVNDVLYQKTPVELENIFKTDKDDRKVILIEGAPGSGKSSLAWHICQKWKSKEMFREFQIVVFVELRDPIIQSAMSIKDILPRESEKEIASFPPTTAGRRPQIETVVAEFKALRGSGILWVIDGWDEFPLGLHNNSVFRQLIESPDTLNLQYSTVVITSRPIASGDLHPLISSRIEILGFTPIELKKYFTIALKGDSRAAEKLQSLLRDRPVIESSCHLPLNAAIVAHVFQTSSENLPVTLHGVFTSFVLCHIIRHLKKQDQRSPTISSFNSIPPDLQGPFYNICTLAYHGIMKNKVTFSKQDLEQLGLPEELDTLSLLQGVQSFMAFDMLKSYNFLHLSIQELLAAFYISKLQSTEQVKIFRQLFGQPRFAAVFQFYAAFTKLEMEEIKEVLTDIVKNKENKKTSESKYLLLYLLRGLYEAQDVSLCQFVASQMNGTLDLSQTTLTPVDSLSVGYFLSSICHTISGEFKVDLSICSIDDYRLGFILEQLSICKESRLATMASTESDHIPGYFDIDLSRNNIQGNSTCTIAELVSHPAIISKLSLWSNKLQEGEDGLYCFSQALMTNPSFSKLELDSHWENPIHITDKNGFAFGNMLQNNTALKSLSFSKFVSMSDEATFHIAQGLKHNSGLEAIWLPLWNMTAKGKQLLYKALQGTRFFLDDIGKSNYCGYPLACIILL